MTMSIEKRDRLAIEMANELRSYGLKVVLQVHRTGRVRNLRRFLKDQKLSGREPFFWATETWFAFIIKEGDAQGIDMEPSRQTGWVNYSAAAPLADNEICTMMIERLINEHPILLLPTTVGHFKNAVKNLPRNSATKPLVMTLWLLAHYVRWLRRPTRLVMKPGGVRLTNLRWMSVAAVVVPLKLRV